MVSTAQQIGIIALFIIGAYILSRLLNKGEEDDYDKLYGEILNSDKHKVKGRFEE